MLARIQKVVNEMRIDRFWAMPSRWTFTIKPIRLLLAEEMGGGVWIDPFAGKNSPATETNDLNSFHPALYHLPAIDFLGRYASGTMDGFLFDPPYSPRQVKECYD